MVIHEDNGGEPLVSTIVRVHSLSCLPLLKRALFSLAGQQVKILVLLITQGFLETDVSAIASVMGSYRGLGAIADVIITNVENEYKKDIRSRLLNVGISFVKTKYIAFLDFDDILYPNCYKDLIGKIERNTAAIAFGGILTARYQMVGGRPYVTEKYREYLGVSKYDLFVDNFCPIHSFVIDRTAVNPSKLLFDEELSAYEDYSFLLEIVATYRSDFSHLETVVGEYYKGNGGSIDRASRDLVDIDVQFTNLEFARLKIAHKKRGIVTSVPLSEFGWLRGPGHQPKIIEETIATRSSNSAHSQFAVAGLPSLLASLDLEALPVAELGMIDHFADNTVGGWVREPQFCGEVDLIAVLSDGVVDGDFERFDRHDVRRNFNSEYGEHGFRYEHKRETGLEKVVIIAVARDEGKAYRLSALIG